MDKIVVLMSIALGVIVLMLGSVFTLTHWPYSYAPNHGIPKPITSSATVDTSRIHLLVYPTDQNNAHLTGEVITKSLDAAAATEPAKELMKLNRSGTFAQIEYLSVDQVHVLKNSVAFPFLPDSSDAIQVLFGAPVSPNIEEYAMVYVYLDPKTFHVFGFIKGP